MAIQFSCSACGKRLAVKDENAGRRSKCPGCGGEILIPAPAEVAVGAHEPPPVPSLSIGEDWKRRPDEGEPLEIPGLQASPDDDAEDDDPGPLPVAQVPGVQSIPARLFPLDPWYYNALDCLGYYTSAIGAACFVIFAIAVIGALVGLVPAGSSDIVVSMFIAALSLMPSGAVIQLFVDIARNVRRLRLHADRNAGIEFRRSA